LHSQLWSDKAWGAYFSAGLRSGELSDALVEELRLADPLRDSTGGAQSAYVQALLDALIQSGSTVPADAVLPFRERWRAETLILLSRGGGNEEALLDLRKEKLDGEEWLLVSNLLFRMRSGRFFASILQEKTVTHTFEIHGASGIGSGWGGGVGGVSCGDGVGGFPKGFPPIGKYQLTVAAQAGDVVVAEGPKNVYYRRIVVPKDSQIGWGHCTMEGEPEMRRMEYLAAIGAFDVEGVRRIFEPTDTILWQNAEHAGAVMKASLQLQVETIRGFVKTAGQRGWSGAAGVSLRITPVVHDDRQDKHEAVPGIAAVEFTLE